MKNHIFAPAEYPRRNPALPLAKVTAQTKWWNYSTEKCVPPPRPVGEARDYAIYSQNN